MKNHIRLALAALFALGLAASTQGASAASFNHGSQTVTGGPSGGSTNN